jgi:hypothetical protein
VTAPFGSFQKGGTIYPLATSTGHSALFDVDPSLYYTLEYFKSVLQTHLGARLVAEATAAGLNGSNVITQAVQYALPYDPLTVIEEQQFGKFPLLAVWRTTEKEKWKTIGRMDTEDLWKVAYVLPPLTGGQRERLQPLLKAARDIILDRIENCLDPGFMSGAEVWKLAGLEELNLLGGDTGHYEIPKSELVMPAWIGNLQVIERQENTARAALLGKFSGVDVTITDSSQGAPVDMVDLSIDVADPTVIAGFLSLYRSDLGVTANTTQDQATTWADQGASHHDQTAAGASNEPYILRDPETDQNILRFDGVQANTTATIAALGANTGKTIVVAFRLWDTAQRASLVLATDGTTAGTVSIEANTTSSAGGLMGLYASGSSFDTQFPTTPGWRIAVLRISISTPGGDIASSVNLRIDDLPAVLTRKSGSGNWSSLGAATTLAVGGMPFDLSHTDARADVGVVMAFSANLSDADTATCIAFCKQWLDENV